MKQIEIIINKVEVLDEISLNSAYAGTKTVGEEGFYDRVATVEADSLLLSRFWTEMYGEVTEKFREFIVKAEKTETDFSLTLELSNAYDESLTPSVREDIFGGMVKGMMAYWFRYTCPDKSPEWQKESSSLLSRAFAKLCFRKRPRRGE